MEKTQVLFVDDDVALGQVVTLALKTLGYKADYCTMLAGIQGVVKELDPDVIVLDVEVGDRNGIDAVPELKAVVPHTPIIFVSSHTAPSEIADGLAAGGVAYVKKPFDIKELLAYVQRHIPSFRAKGIPVGKFHLRMEDDMLMKGEEPVKRLTPFESKILKLLAQNINKVVKREELEKELWQDASSSEHSLNNYIAKLRKYLAEDETLTLETVSRTGYMLSSKKEK